MTVGLGVAAPAAQAAQLTVDDDRRQCPSAGYTAVAPAVAAAAPGDTVSVCDGTYREGAGGAGTTALRIDKPITLRGAGPGRTFIAAAGGAGGRIASPGAGAASLFDGVGNVITVQGVEADLEGFTVFGDDVFAEAGIGYLDADGDVSSVEVVDLVRRAELGGDGGYGETGTGVGIVAAGTDPARLRSVTVRDSVVEGYNDAGIVLRGVAGSALGVFGLVTGSRITGAGSQGAPGQDGIRIQDGATAVIVENLISDHRGGSGATDSVAVRYGPNPPASSQTRVNLNSIQGNDFGVLNDRPSPAVTVTGADVPVDAAQNWWGSPSGPTTFEQPAGGDRVNGTRRANLAPPGPPTTPAPAPQPTPGTTQFVDYRDLLSIPAPVPSPGSGYVDAQPAVTLEAPADGAQVQPGAAVALRASAADDVGIRSVTFRRGATVLARDDVAPYEATYVPSAAEAGSSQVVVAIAEDSRGQTSADARSLGVAAPVAPPAADRPPTLRFDAPGPRPSSARFTVRVGAGDDRGVASVRILLGDRVICTDTTAPYACTVSAQGDEVGRNALVAVVTDTAGQTAAAVRSVTVARLATRSVSASSTARGGLVTTRGRIGRPAGVTAAQGCDGSVRVGYARGSRTIATRTVSVSRSCAYSVRRRLSSGRYTVSARFLGNDVLRARSARTGRVTVR